MGKASKWFNRFLSCHGRRRKPPSYDSYTADFFWSDSNKHALQVAAATSAAADAAIAAVKAAEEVVRLTSNALPDCHVSGRRGWFYEDDAAVKIQSAFRGYLARKALRALKGLVRIQALWRGHFVRKRSTDMLRCLQALVRAQNRAVANRMLNLESTHCSARTEDLSVLKRLGSITSIKGANWLESWVEDRSSINAFKLPNRNYDEKSDKILEIDTNSKTRSTSRAYQNHITVQDIYNRSFAASGYSAKYSHKPSDTNVADEDVVSLQSIHYESARRSPKTPLRDNEGSRSFVSGSPSPNFMANTKSSRAKARSQSVPRQREGEEANSKRSIQVLWEIKSSLRRKSDSFF